MKRFENNQDNQVLFAAQQLQKLQEFSLKIKNITCHIHQQKCLDHLCFDQNCSYNYQLICCLCIHEKHQSHRNNVIPLEIILIEQQVIYKKIIKERRQFEQQINSEVEFQKEQRQIFIQKIQEIMRNKETEDKLSMYELNRRINQMEWNPIQRNYEQMISKDQLRKSNMQLCFSCIKSNAEEYSGDISQMLINSISPYSYLIKENYKEKIQQISQQNQKEFQIFEMILELLKQLFNDNKTNQQLQTKSSSYKILNKENQNEQDSLEISFQDDDVEWPFITNGIQLDLLFKKIIDSNNEFLDVSIQKYLNEFNYNKDQNQFNDKSKFKDQESLISQNPMNLEEQSEKNFNSPFNNKQSQEILNSCQNEKIPLLDITEKVIEEFQNRNTKTKSNTKQLEIQSCLNEVKLDQEQNSSKLKNYFPPKLLFQIQNHQFREGNFRQYEYNKLLNSEKENFNKDLYEKLNAIQLKDQQSFPTKQKKKNIQQ